MTGPKGDFISSYMQYTDATEVPAWFSRWAAICGIGALLSRQFYFHHGHFKVNPNLYVMLIGEPGTKKSTAIKLIKQHLKLAGYTTFAPNKTSKEQFLRKLADQAASSAAGTQDMDAILSANIFGTTADELSGPTDCFICADEFNNFLGNGNIEFISILGELWDYEGLYENELKNSKSDFIPDPTISILSGNTQTNFTLAFPPEIFGQGFFSRIMLIYCNKERAKITFPPTPSPEATAGIIDGLKTIRAKMVGQAEFSGAAKKLVDKIYRTWPGISDPRFSSYSNRRLAQLIKLTLIHAAADFSTSLREIDVIRANTVLTHAESFMPAALGEFGKAKNSDVSHTVMRVIDDHFLRTTEGISFREIWTVVHKDLDDLKQLGEILRNLAEADKIQRTDIGILPKKPVQKLVPTDTVDFSYLTDEEKGIES